MTAACVQMQTLLTPVVLPAASHTAAVCAASSRVGASISTIGPCAARDRGGWREREKSQLGAFCVPLQRSIASRTQHREQKDESTKTEKKEKRRRDDGNSVCFHDEITRNDEQNPN